AARAVGSLHEDTPQVEATDRAHDVLLTGHGPVGPAPRSERRGAGGGGEPGRAPAGALGPRHSNQRAARRPRALGSVCARAR
ncbi:hypothetical protein, partial [Streptomyces sp. NPDC059742]|uniref:hypothetical protein n=1 Tax=Streptomyces sp. NPDC059742 TaxID=3346927 RepID=UPI00364B50CF